MKLAEVMGVSPVVVRAGIVVIGVVLALILLLCVCKFFIWFDQRSDYNFYKENIPEVQRQLSDLQLEIVQLERDLEFCRVVVQDKVLAATKELDLTALGDEAKWLVETCQKIDNKKLNKKLAKKRCQEEECEEWLREAREKYATLSEKFGGR